MDPLTISLILSGAKAGFGALQAHKGNKLAKQAVRPSYQIPSAVNQYLANAQTMAQNQRLPGQSAIEENISGSTAQGVRAAQESANNPAALMATIAALNANQNNALTDVGVKGAEMQQNNQMNLQGALQNYAGYQDKAFDINQMQPYQQKAAAATALKGAGIQNIWGGVENAGGTLMNMSAQNADKKKYEAMIQAFLSSQKGQPTTGGDINYPSNLA